MKLREGVVIVPRLHKSGELQEWVKKLCLPGVSDVAVAGILGVRTQTIYVTRKSLGIPAGLPRSSKIHKPEKANISTKAKFLYLYSGIGRSDTEIARIIGVTTTTIRQIRVEFGLPALGDRIKLKKPKEPLKRRRSVDIDAAVLIVYGKDGCPDEVISEVVDIDPGSVSEYRKRVGLPSFNKPTGSFGKREKHSGTAD